MFDAKFNLSPQWWWGIGTAVVIGTTKLLHSVFLTKSSGFKYFQDKETCNERHNEIKADIKEIKADQKVIAADIKEILKNGRK